jgi:hypothetical protein
MAMWADLHQGTGNFAEPVGLMPGTSLTGFKR